MTSGKTRGEREKRKKKGSAMINPFSLRTFATSANATARVAMLFRPPRQRREEGNQRRRKGVGEGERGKSLARGWAGPTVNPREG